MTEQKIIYDSTRYTVIPKIKAVVFIRGKEENCDARVVEEWEFAADEIRVFDGRDFLYTEFRYGENPASEARFLEFEKYYHEKNPYRIYNGYDVWWKIYIYPDRTNENLYLSTINFFEVRFGLHNNFITFFSQGKFSGVFSDGVEYPSEKLAEFCEAAALTEEELRFIREAAADQQLAPPTPLVFGRRPGRPMGGMAATAVKEEDELDLSDSDLQIFDPSQLAVHEGEKDSQTALSKLIGLEAVKEEIAKLRATLYYRKRQRERGIFVENAASMHMCFTGAPGTGKTTVARIVTGILYDYGLLKTNRYIEINGQELKAGFLGQSARKTQIILKKARNKVLFIDEAYALLDEYENGYGKEVVATLLKHMEDERDSTIVIFAGYKKNIDEFLQMNAGLKSRVNRYIHFENYTTAELVRIFMKILSEERMYISEAALQKAARIMKRASASPQFSNARFARNMFDKIRYEHAYNVRNTTDLKRKDTVELEDIPDNIADELLAYSK